MNRVWSTVAQLYYACRMASSSAARSFSPDRKRPKLDESVATAQANSKEPLPESDSAKTEIVLVLCGSMNPITFLHLRMFELARDWLQKTGKYVVREGIITPVHDAYGKKGLVASSHRLTMCNLAISSSSWLRVDPWETEQNGWTETQKVLQHYQKKAMESRTGNVRVNLLCGADLLESFATPGLWTDEDIRSIVEDFGLVVISRFGSNPEAFVYEDDTLSTLKNHIHIITEWIPNDVSSTKIRRSIRRGESVKYLVHDDVIEYIDRHRLYKLPEVDPNS